jgi:ketosteroid isomerase-like protein
MSQENVEVVRRVWEEFQAVMQRGDPGTWFDSEAVADDLEFTLEGVEMGGRSVWHGRGGFVEFVRTWTEDFEGWEVELEQLIDAGEDRVVGLLSQSARGRASGVPVEMNLAVVYELDGGRVVRVRNYLDHDEALEAAGLSE